MKKLGVILLSNVIVALLLSCTGEKAGLPVITFSQKEKDKKIEVRVDGKLFTVFQWPDNICKPVLYPVYASSGTEITRGFPVDPKAGERADHPHQIGIWLTYGNVNGNDFWGNGSQGLGTKNRNGGVIKHIKTEEVKDGIGTGIIVSLESWTDTAGIETLKEKTEYRFSANGNVRIIDRITTLTANKKDVAMPDTKEGMFGIRVARQLELPVKGSIELYNADGTVTRTKDSLNIGITGNYTSSEGITGEAVWGTRAKWMKLEGNIGGENISIVVCDHPQNLDYPTYWHARGYGLFAANPLGVKDFTKGAESLNFVIPAGKSATFRYRVIITSGTQMTEQEINDYLEEFSSANK